MKSHQSGITEAASSLSNLYLQTRQNRTHKFAEYVKVFCLSIDNIDDLIIMRSTILLLASWLLRIQNNIYLVREAVDH